MGCNCGGSTPRVPRSEQEPRQLRRQAETVTQKPPTPRRTGGPGSPEYYWDGGRAASKPAGQ